MEHYATATASAKPTEHTMGSEHWSTENIRERKDPNACEHNGELACFAGKAFTFVELLPCAVPGGEPTVVCTDGSGRRHGAPLSAWNAARDTGTAGNDTGTDRAEPPAKPAPAISAASPFAPSVPTPQVHRRSSPADKVSLFRSLFRGRDDVYAKGFRDRKPDAKPDAISYAPACLNEWTPPCRTVGHKCRICRHRENAPLTDEIIAAHLSSTNDDFKGAVGLYVMRSDDTVALLATDFDGTGWQCAAAAFRQACRDRGFDVAVERSRSGNGAHAWLFFDAPVEARAARALGTSLLTDAIGRCDALSLASYDRMFPAQDTRTAEGFGSLIALPLQGWARARGNAVFVDDDLIPYDDQWAYLASVRRVEAAEVVPFAKAAKAALGPLVALDAMTDSLDPLAASTGGSPSHDTGPAGEQLLLESDSTAPFPTSAKRTATGRARTRRTPLSPADFPAELRITWHGMLLVPRKGLSPAALDALRRLAAFANPAFYLAQSMRRSVRGIDRVVYAGRETPDTVGLPRGCIDSLRALLDQAGVAYSIDDRRFEGRPVDMAFSGSLRPEQEPAVRALLKHDMGILSAPTGFGKTVVGAALVGNLKVSALVLVPRTALLNQWRDELV